MNAGTGSEGTFQLPADIVEIVELAKRIVEKELLPLEPEFLPHPGHAFGIKETTNLRTVFGEDTVKHLMQISRDTGLWYLMVPEKYGGSGLSMLAQVAILEQFNYTAVPFPFANVGRIFCTSVMAIRSNVS